MAMCKRCHRALYQEDYDAGDGYCPECRKSKDAEEARERKAVKPRKADK